MKEKTYTKQRELIKKAYEAFKISCNKVTQKS